ncbi:MAG: DUF5688 family protein [Blautia sp.]|uniref:DUF5688 family protein n=1 Tax=Blautia sp. TaxID=1955243 RepID=UPI003994CCF2
MDKKTIADKLSQKYLEIGYVSVTTMAMRDWNIIKNFIYPIILPRAKKYITCSNLLFNDYLDLMVCYVIGELRNVPTKIYKGMEKVWNVSKEEIHYQAIKNMKNGGYYIKGIGETIDTVITKEGKVVLFKEKRKLMYIMTNPSKLYGAAGILDVDMIARFADKHEANIFLLPSSIHEMVVVIDDGSKSVDELNHIVQEVNAEQVVEKEWLGDYAYYYDRTNRKIRQTV